jgi:hypothetical protein
LKKRNRSYFQYPVRPKRRLRHSDALPPHHCLTQAGHSLSERVASIRATTQSHDRSRSLRLGGLQLAKAGGHQKDK